MSQFGLIPGTDQQTMPSDDREPRRRSRRTGRHSGRLAVVISLVVVAGLAIGAVVAGQSLLTRASDALLSGPPDYPGPGPGTTAVVIVEPGDSASDIGVTLADNDVVASVEAFTEAASRDAAATGIQPGTYQMPQQIPAEQALALLADPGNRVVDAVLVREGLRVADTLAAYQEQAGMDRAALEAAVGDPAAIGLPPEADGSAEGFLFPATYEVQPSTTEVDALAAMTAKYADVAAELSLADGGAALGLTPREVVTVASIIQAEARLPEDFPRIARVIYNRLQAGQPLQMDSTVAYANGVSTVFTTDEQREVDSPYNTYLNPGLPPGPINSPGEQALRAALNPADGPWLYFVTVNLDTGETRYSQTLEEHNRNVAELQRWIAENQS
jgi:UPF0755 protein